MTRKSSKQLKFVAFIMSLVMLMTVAPFSAFAEDGVIDTSEAIDQTVLDDEIISDVEPAAVENAAVLTAADVPEFIAMSDLTTRGTIRRVYEEEADLSTILFENNDGTRTLYMYGVPVKYVAPDGTTRDKSTAISSLSGLQALWNGTTLTPGQMTTLAQNASIGRLELGQAAEALSLMNTRLIATYGATLKLSDMAYASLDSDVRSLYPTAVSDGVVLNYGDYSIRTIPVATGSLVLPGAANVAESSSLTDNDVRTRVRYSNAFGLGTILQYTPTTMGVKEEIILTSNVGKNSFSFRIETDGLTIQEENGNYYFFDPATQRVIAQLGEIIAYDSNGQIARGAVTVQSVIVGQRYNVTISVSPEFLANAAYPVSVDPTVTLEPDVADPKYDIDYVSVYDTSDASSVTFDAFHSFGYIANSTGFPYYGGAFFRFPGFYTPSCDYYGITSAAITDMTLYLDTWTTENESITLIANPVNCSWTPGTRIYGANYYYNSSDSTYQGSGTRDANGRIAVDLTQIAKVWADYENDVTTYGYGDPRCGVILKAQHENNSNNYCTVMTSDVSATLTYNPTILVDQTNITMTVGTSRSVSYESIPHYSAVPVSLNNNIATATKNNFNIVITAHSAGTTKIKVYAASTSETYQEITVNVIPKVSACSGINSGSVYMIKNISETDYLTAVGSGVSLAYGDSTEGKFLWYVEWNGNGYRLCSMGAKDETTGKEVYLSADSQLTTSGSSWIIHQANSGGYYITANTPSTMTQSLTPGQGVELANYSDEGRWVFEEVSLSSFDSYYSGSYATMAANNGKLHIQVVVAESVWNGVYQPTDFAVLSAWNNISDNVIIYPPDVNPPSGVTPFVVTYTNVPLMGETLGETHPNDSNSLGGTFNYATIYLDKAKGILEENSSYREAVILHEMGHVLKLAHPNLNYGDDNTITSVMNWGNPLDDSNLATVSPSKFDMINLKNKFGG